MSNCSHKKTIETVEINGVMHDRLVCEKCKEIFKVKVSESQEKKSTK